MPLKSWGKYGAGDFENANAVFILPGNTVQTFLKLRMPCFFQGTTGQTLLKTKRSFGQAAGSALVDFYSSMTSRSGRQLPGAFSFPVLNRLCAEVILSCSGGTTNTPTQAPGIECSATLPGACFLKGISQCTTCYWTI
jgi:hypothetical protein